MIEFDRRKTERFSLELPTYLSIADKYIKRESLEIITSNISSGGAFFKTEKPLPVGTDVKIDLIIPLDKLNKLKGKKSRIDVSGSVIRTNKNGMAICFDKRYKITPY